MSNEGDSDMTLGSREPGQEPRSGTAERPLGAQGYGLDETQQKVASDLWAWQKESLRSAIVLGGPISE